MNMVSLRRGIPSNYKPKKGRYKPWVLYARILSQIRGKRRLRRI